MPTVLRSLSRIGAPESPGSEKCLPLTINVGSEGVPPTETIRPELSNCALMACGVIAGSAVR